MGSRAIGGLIAIAYATSETHALTAPRGHPLTHTDMTENETSSLSKVFSDMEFADVMELNDSEVVLDPSGRHWNRLHPKNDPLNYMRIPKTGSTTLFDVLFTAKDKFPLKCLKVQWNRHDMLPIDAEVQGRTFAVIRNPCERFLSQWDHVKSNNNPLLPRWNSCQPGTRSAAGRPSKFVCCWKLRGCPDGAIDAAGMQALQSPTTWGQYLLSKPSVRNRYMDRDYVFASCHSMVAMWHQSAWIGENTHVACLPSMIPDINRILATEAPGCVFEAPEVDKNLRAHPEEFSNNAEVCGIAKQLYPDDVRLWNDRCGAQHGYV